MSGSAFVVAVTAVAIAAHSGTLANTSRAPAAQPAASVTAHSANAAPVIGGPTQSKTAPAINGAAQHQKR